MNWKPELEELERRTTLAHKMGGAERIKRQHDGGRLTIRERIDGVADAKSFREIGALAGMADYDERNELTGFYRVQLLCLAAPKSMAVLSSSWAMILPCAAVLPMRPSAKSR